MTTAELCTVDMFSNKIGQAFVIEESDTSAIALTLVEATPLRNSANAPRAPFSLVFTAQGSPVLPQRIYALRHEALGLRSFFLVPVAKDGNEVTYQAVFN